jgi:hypothetical protein
MTENTPTTNTAPAAAATIDPDLLSILRCPLTRSKLHQEGDFLVAEVGGLQYPIRDGIPVMLADEARQSVPGRVVDPVDPDAPVPGN